MDYILTIEKRFEFYFIMIILVAVIWRTSMEPGIAIRGYHVYQRREDDSLNKDSNNGDRGPMCYIF